MTRKFNDLVTRGALQSSSTSLLLGISPDPDHATSTTPGAPVRDSAEPQHADSDPTDSKSTTVVQHNENSDEHFADTQHPNENSPTPDPSTPTPTAPTTKTHDSLPSQTHNDSQDSSRGDSDETIPGAAATPHTSGLGPLLEMLPSGTERLLTGPRRDIEVRDLTYDVPTWLYFSFTRLKTELARCSKRKVTNPDLMDVALSLLATDLNQILDQIEQYAHIVFDDTNTRRRLTVRVSETRYRQLVDTALDIEEHVGKRVPVTDLWTLSIAVLLDQAGRLQQPA